MSHLRPIVGATLTCLMLAAGCAETPTTTTALNAPRPDVANVVAPPQVAVGALSTCVLRSDETVTCWGMSLVGPMPSPAGTFSQIGGSFYFFCGIQSNQGLACWGLGWETISKPAGAFTQVGGGQGYACALRTNATVVCFGDLIFGIGTVPATTFKKIAVGQGFAACGIRLDDTLACWGAETPEYDRGQTRPPGGTFRDISAGNFHACGIRMDESVTCWGAIPAPPAGQFSRLNSEPTGFHACGIRVDGTLACWGDNTFGQASPPSGEFIQVSGGVHHSCAVRVDNAVVCWGVGPGLNVPPDLANPNRPPVADAGAPQVAECVAGRGTVTLDGSGSSDVDGTIVRYNWLDVQDGSDPRATLSLAMGTHAFTLEVTDDDGAVHSASTTVKIHDTQPPVIDLRLTETVLWPPNHELRLVASAIGATDVCEGPANVAVTITSSEAANGKGDGNTSSDWSVVRRPDGLLDVYLRAERSGTNGVRTYTLVATATDGSGNPATRRETVTVRR